MRYNIKVVPSAGDDSVKADDKGVLVVRTTAPAERNRANKAVLQLLGMHFGKTVRLVAGSKSKRKVVEVVMNA